MDGLLRSCGRICSLVELCSKWAGIIFHVDAYADSKKVVRLQNCVRASGLDVVEPVIGLYHLKALLISPSGHEVDVWKKTRHTALSARFRAT